MRLPDRPLLLMGLLACSGDPKTTPPVTTGDDSAVAAEPVCALPSGAGDVGVADANHDGQVDVSDATYTLRYLMAGGPAPACLDMQDLLSDDILDMGDGLAVLYYLFTGQVELPSASRYTCDTINPIADAPCGALTMGLDGASTVSGAAGATTTSQVSVTLASPDLDVSAWSFGVVADGCTITGASEDGTAIADVRLDEAGHRDMGFSRSDVVATGLTHGALLSWERDVVLSAQEDSYKLLTLSVDATAPASGCATCTLKLSGELAGAGIPVSLVVTSGGRSYTPTTRDLSVEVCAE